MDKWVAHVKGEEGNYEVTVCYGEPSISWGWYGPAKIRLEMNGTLEVGRKRAEQIAAALNAAKYEP